MEHINIFGYLGAWGGGGGGGFNNQTGPILVHIYPLFYINLHVKYKSNMITKKMCGHVGPLHKIKGYQGHQNISKRRPHHNGDICTTMGNNLKTSFSYMSQNVKANVDFGLFRWP